MDGPHQAGTVGTAARAALGLGLSVAALILFSAATRSAAPSGGWLSPGHRPDETLLILLAWVGTALAGWLALGSALTLASTVPGAVGRCSGRLADRLTPALVRRALTVVLSTTSVSVVLPPATVVGTVAAPLPTGRPTGEPNHQAGRQPLGQPMWPAGAVGPGFVPTPALSAQEDAAADPGYHSTTTPETSKATTPGFRPTRPAPALDSVATGLLARAPRPAVAALDTVTVRRGDSLWSIARHHLGSTATDAEVSRAWPRWYAANRAVIGDDPDVIHPGTQLVPPREGDIR